MYLSTQVHPETVIPKEDIFVHVSTAELRWNLQQLRALVQQLFLDKGIGFKCLASLLGVGGDRLSKKAAGAPDLRFGKRERKSGSGTWSVDGFLQVGYDAIAETLPDELLSSQFYLLATKFVDSATYIIHSTSIYNNKETESYPYMNQKCYYRFSKTNEFPTKIAEVCEKGPCISQEKGSR